MLINCITSICRSMESRADIIVWFVYAISVWSNTVSPLPENTIRLRYCVEGQVKPGTWPPSGHVHTICIISICWSMESMTVLLLWFINEIISWIAGLYSLPRTLGRLLEYDGGQANRPEPWPPSRYFIIGYNISNGLSVPHKYKPLFACICPTAQLSTGICSTHSSTLTHININQFLWG